LAGTHDDDGVISTFVFGDLLQHPVGAVISVRTRSTPLTDAELEALRPSFVTASTPVPEPGERVGERRVLTDEPRPTFEEDFRFPNGLRMTTRYTLWPTAEVLIETLYWENAPEPWIDAARRLPTTLSEAPCPASPPTPTPRGPPLRGMIRTGMEPELDSDAPRTWRSAAAAARFRERFRREQIGPSYRGWVH